MALLPGHRGIHRRNDLALEQVFDILCWRAWGGRRVRERFVVRETDYGYGVWDLLVDDWWIPRLDMSARDAQLIVDELNQGNA